ncbi:hypothetical protein CHH58_15925 [Terribacillus saccharophilus]|uniref:Nramp family divalent metal transporter n=1 Tax=Terribacillus saccharophilus TaxID=361277 RepID=UPI000BA70ACF|nr:Nramp family divalent metal transporter [Terribacillus saccharophilus]PAF35545.1 hypothetical protein CHH58_15925 [Terribacillus saccharophilus]
MSKSLKDLKNSEVPVRERNEAPSALPKTFMEYMRSLGPGLVLAMTFLGTGDLVSSTVSGANYGYALLWTLVVALAARYFMVSAVAKYKLQNRHGDTSILQGFQRVWSGFPLLLGVAILFLGIVIQMSFLRACAVALYNLFGGFGGETWGVFLFSLVVVGLTFLLLINPNQYKLLEMLARFASVAIIAAFVFALFRIGSFDVIGFFKGLTFDMPPNQGPFNAIFIAVATIGAIGGSAVNLLYPYFMEDKGWDKPKYRKIQQLDLITGMLPLLVINVLFWVVAAEVFYGTGIPVSNENDLALMMELAVGSAGPTMLWVCLFLAAFTSFPAQARGFTLLMLNGFHLSAKKNYKKTDEDPKFRYLSIGLFLLLPILISIPGAPDLVLLNVFGTSVITALILPPIVVGLVLMTSSRKYMMEGYKNRWWETGILVIIAVIGIWSTVEIIRNFVDQISKFI